MNEKNAKPLQESIHRWMYGETLERFFCEDAKSILGALMQQSAGSIELTQRNAWEEQIQILKSLDQLNDLVADARIYLELTVPRLGRRADVVLLIQHVMFILEFKAGESTFNRSALDQVWDYALDFKNFHESSHEICIIPVLVATKASEQPMHISATAHDDGLTRPVCVAPSQLADALLAGLAHFTAPVIDADHWECGRYMPTPTIVEAARALYAGHSVEAISRSDAGAINLQSTSKAVDEIIAQSRAHHRKAICFVTGVPGAGKTLVGLDAANRHLDSASETYSVFLSGNGPLVAVLREALTCDRVEQASKSG